MDPLKHFLKKDTKSKNRWRQCPYCKGYKQDPPCPHCNNTGIIRIDKRSKNAIPSILNPSPPLNPPNIPRYGG